MKKIKAFIGMLCLIAMTAFLTFNANSAMAEEWDGQKASISVSSPENAIPGEDIVVSINFNFGTMEGVIDAISFEFYISNYGEYTVASLDDWIFHIVDENGQMEEAVFEDTILGDAGYDWLSSATKFGDETLISFQLCWDKDDVNAEQVGSFSVDVPIKISDEISSSLIVTVEDESPSNAIMIDMEEYSDEYADIHIVGQVNTITITAPSSETGLDSVTVDSTVYGENGSKSLEDLWDNGVEVDAETDSVSVVIDPKDKVTLTSVTYTDSDSQTITVSKVNGAYEITLNPSGSDTVVTIATKAETPATSSFSFTISRDKYNDTRLTGLAIALPSSYTDGGKLGSFTYNKELETQTYTLNVPEGLTALDFTATVNADTLMNTSIEVKDQAGNLLGTLTSGTKGTISYDKENVTSIILVAKAQDDTTEEYTINLKKLSDDTNLDQDGIKAYQIDAEGNVTSTEITLTEDLNTSGLFTGSVAYTGVTGFSVVADKNHAKAEIDFYPTSKEVYYGSTDYEKTPKPLTITVTSESGIEKIYTVSIERGAASDDKSLKDYSVTSGTGTDLATYSKRSDSTDYLWIYEVPASITTVTINVETTSEVADIKINNVSKGTSISESHTNGSATDFIFTVYAQDQTVYQQYTIKVVKAKETYNDIDSISLLEEQGGDTLVDSNNKSLSFNKMDTNPYEFEVPYSVSSIYLEATSGTTDNNTTVYLKKGSEIALSGKTTYGYTFVLSEGLNTFTVYAKSESNVDGTSYTIKITRTQGDTDNSLKNLTVAGQVIISNGQLQADIEDNGNYTYTIYVDRDEDTTNNDVYVDAVEANSTKSKFKASDYLGVVHTISDGDLETISIKVTPEKGDARTYNIKVVRKETLNSINNVEISYDLNGKPQTPISVADKGSIEIPFGATDIKLNVVADAYHASVSTQTLTLTNFDQDTNSYIQTYSGNISVSTSFVSHTIKISSEAGVEASTKITFSIKQLPGNNNISLKTLIIGDIVLIENGSDNSNVVKDSKTNAYIVRFDRGTQKIDIYAEASQTTTQITNDSINPTYQYTETGFVLTDGEMISYSVNVKAQNGATHTYNINIYCVEDKNTLSDVKITYDLDGDSKTLPLANNNPDGYTIPYGAANIKLNVETDAYYATVKAGSSYILSNLDSSQNPTLIYSVSLNVNSTFDQYSITVASEYETKTQTTIQPVFTFKVKQAQGDQTNTLKTLTVGNVNIIENGNANPDVKVVNGVYVLNFDRDTTSVNLTAEASVNVATITNGATPSYAYSENINLTAGGVVNKTITVKPQTGDNKEYKIEIHTKEDKNTISQIDITYTDADGNSKSLDNPFTQTGETFNVPSGATNVKIVVLTDALYATLVGKYGTNKTNSVTGTNLDDNNNKIYYYTLVPTLSSGKTYDFDLEITSEFGTEGTTWQVTLVVPSSGGSGSGGPTNPETKNTITNIEVIDSNNKNYFEFPSTSVVTLEHNIGNVTIKVDHDGTLGTLVIEEDGTPITGMNISVDQGAQKPIKIYYISQAGVRGTEYTFTIGRNEPSKDSSLASLSVNGALVTLKDGKYEYIVDGTIDTASIIAIPNHSGAKVTPTCTASNPYNVKLAIGINSYQLVVTAEDTSTTTYDLIIYRGEDKNTITSLTVEYKIITETNPVQVVVDLNNIKDVEVPFSATDIKVTYTYDGKSASKTEGLNILHTPTVGNPSHVDCYVVSQIGNEGDHVTFDIIRKPADTDDTLKSLEVLVDGVNKISYNGGNIYEIEYVDPTVLQVVINAIANSDYAYITGTGSLPLANAIVTGNTMLFPVKVYSEYQMSLPQSIRKSNDYLIYLSRDSVDLSDNNQIDSIIIKSGAEIFFSDFDPNNPGVYNVVLPYYVTNIDIVPTSPADILKFDNSLTDLDFNFDFIVEYQLPLTIEVWAVSNLGNEGTKYTFSITRQIPDDDATLSDLKINTVTVSGFNPEQYTYNNITVDYSVSKINIVPYVNAVGKSTYTITVDGVLTNGSNIQLTPNITSVIAITVTAQNGNSKIYTVSITRTSDTGSLDVLYIEGVPFTDEEGNPITYSKDVFEYYAIVSYAYESVNVVGSSSDLSIQIRGIGIRPLDVGVNELPVDAVPKTGNVGRYTIYIIRKAEASDSTNVDFIKIDEIDSFETDYANTINVYGTYKVPSSVNELTFTINFDNLEYQDPATYKIINNELHYGLNTVVVLITSSDLSAVRPIIVNVEREDIKVSSASINQISKFAKEYKNDLNSYSYRVNNNVSKLDISFLLEDSSASYEISNTELKYGSNVIEVKLFNGEDVNRIIYINVYRGSTSTISALDYVMGGLAAVVLVGAFFLLRKKKRTI